MTDQPDIDPQRAPGAFAHGLTQLRVADDGLAPGYSIYFIDVMASLAEIVKRVMGAERTIDEGLLRRLAMATLDVLSTAFAHTPEDREIVETWRNAYAEWLCN
jgi:hypothetical protein